MILNPLDVLNPVFHFLDEVIADDGVYLYLGLVWLSLILIAWICSGGLRRKSLRGKPMPYVPPVIVIYFTAGRPTPPTEPFDPFPPFHGPPECSHDDYLLD